MKCDRDGFYCQKRRAVRETRYLELGPFPIIIARLSGLIAALIWRLSALRPPPPSATVYLLHVLSKPRLQPRFHKRSRASRAEYLFFFSPRDPNGTETREAGDRKLRGNPVFKTGYSSLGW